MTMPLSRRRFQVAIPAQGMIEIRDALTDLLKEFGTDDQGKNIIGHARVQSALIFINNKFLLIMNFFILL